MDQSERHLAVAVVVREVVVAVEKEQTCWVAAVGEDLEQTYWLVRQEDARGVEQLHGVRAVRTVEAVADAQEDVAAVVESGQLWVGDNLGGTQDVADAVSEGPLLGQGGEQQRSLVHTALAVVVAPGDEQGTHLLEQKDPLELEEFLLVGKQTDSLRPGVGAVERKGFLVAGASVGGDDLQKCGDCC